ncbi:LLM class flavin-dependent oxidoreductase [Mycobacterium kubicae]|uniref:LLM class flavin-dependent oxidoreductase n=1 Tax=Mycobacterium kubicae TaxID=120959 RepID=UPI0009EF3283|nr:LLM class flavin-dependent oxidoreductase [Mycobacterium kubicae]
MKIACEVPWQSRQFTVPLERITRCEQLGFDAVFTAEGAGSDALTPLAYIAAHTSKIRLGTHVATVTARPATVLAQGLATIDAMAGGGRVIAGVGAGFPSIAEGWHGRPWGKPVRRMRDYVGVLRQAFASQGARDTSGNAIESTELYWEQSRARLANPVRCQSSETSLPYSGSGALGVLPWAMPVESGFEPEVHLAAVGPQMLELTAEIADGWFPWGFAPGMMPTFQRQLDAGFARRTDGKRRADFDVWAIVDLVVCDDVAAGIDLFRAYVVEWSEYMRLQIEALGFTGLCDRLAELVAAGRRNEALAAVPDDYVDTAFLIGSHRRIAKRLQSWMESGATGLIFRYGPQVQVGAHDIVEDMDIWETIAKATS